MAAGRARSTDTPPPPPLAPFPQADAQGVPAYCECTDSRLLPVLVGTLGFREVEDFTFFGVPVHVLKRDASKGVA